LDESVNQGVGVLMEMRRTRFGGLTRVIGKRIAVLALSAFMLGVIINNGVPVREAAAASQDYPPGPYATSMDYPPGPYADIVIVG
jgi:hypothetical protein